MSAEKKYRNYNLEFWGGIECTINRVKNSYFDQLGYSGHYNRKDDIRLISELGIKTLRYPILWEKHQPGESGEIDWSFTQNRLNECCKYGITPIAGLLHHGSGPVFTSLLDDNFPELFASYAREVAQKFPSLQYYTPVNEPLTTARFSGLYGLWYPHISNDVSFAKMLLNQVKGIILAMKEIKKINPEAKLIQTEDLSKTYSTSSLRYQASFENERRWLTYDLLCGKVKPDHSMWKYFLRLGIKPEQLNFFLENVTIPDIMGFNYYVTSERYLDDDIKSYPLYTHGNNEIQDYADVEAIRINHGHPSGLKILLEEAWNRYHLPIAITEAHINSGREDQLRWLHEIYNECCDAIESGVEVRALTFWSLFGAYGWNKLLTSETMDYEAGAFDLRASAPRPTAIATLIKNFIRENNYNHTLVDQKGWWHQANRFHKKETTKKNFTKTFLPGRPLLIIGKTGMLGSAFGKICSYRNIQYILTDRESLDITNEKNIHEFLDDHNPWGIINAAGLVRNENSEDDPSGYFDTNTSGPVLLSNLCKNRKIAFVTFSPDDVFDGEKSGPYFETDLVNPMSVYGISKAMAEKEIVQENPGALIIRTSHLFGPWDKKNFVINLLNSFAENKEILFTEDTLISPTYIPHLVVATLELLIDNEAGIWHLTNDGSLSRKQFADRIAGKAGHGAHLITSIEKVDSKNPPQRSTVLKSKKYNFLPSLEHALTCFFNESKHMPLIFTKNNKSSSDYRN